VSSSYHRDEVGFSVDGERDRHLGVTNELYRNRGHTVAKVDKAPKCGNVNSAKGPNNDGTKCTSARFWGRWWCWCCWSDRGGRGDRGGRSS